MRSQDATQDTLNDSVAGTPHSQLPEVKHDANFIAKTKNVHSVALAQAAALPEVQSTDQVDVRALRVSIQLLCQWL